MPRRRETADLARRDVLQVGLAGASAPGGVLGYRRGVTAASSDSFEVKIKGVGTHAARPWEGKDPIVVAAQLVTLMQSIVSRQTNLSAGAAVVTVGQIHGGNRY